MAPLRREWEAIKIQARELAAKRDTAPTTAVKTRIQNELTSLVMNFAQKIWAIRVLDPACGSANFLYISLRLLKDLEKVVSNFCGEVGLQPFFPEVTPRATVRHRDQRLRPRTGAGHGVDRLSAMAA